MVSTTLDRLIHTRLAMGTLRAPAMLGAFGFLVSFVGSWFPSLWTDEIATLSAAGRSLPDLFALLGTVDAVHGCYYVFMHVWIAALGGSELSVRLPSAIAIGLTCAGTVKIGQNIGNEGWGITSAFILALLPRVVWAGTEARQYALTAMMAVALTLILMRAWRTNRWQDWFLWSAVSAAGIFLFLFFALAVAAQVVAAVVLRRRAKAAVLSSLVVSAVVAPFMFFTSTQRSQISWMEHHSLLDNLRTYAVKQFFYGDHRPTGNEPPTLVMTASLALAAVLGALAVVALLNSTRDSSRRDLMVLSVVMVAIPAATLIGLSTVTPLYVARYLVFTGPAFALVAGAGLARLYEKNRAAALVTAAAIAVLALIPQLTIKGLINEVPDDSRGIATLVESAAEGGASIIFETPQDRGVMLGYPAEFTEVEDLSLAEPAAESATLWGLNKPVTTIRVSGKGPVLYLAERVDSKLAENKPHLRSAGCNLIDEDISERLTLALFQCPVISSR